MFLWPISGERNVISAVGYGECHKQRKGQEDESAMSMSFAMEEARRRYTTYGRVWAEREVSKVAKLGDVRLQFCA